MLSLIGTKTTVEDKVIYRSSVRAMSNGDLKLRQDSDLNLSNGFKDLISNNNNRKFSRPQIINKIKNRKEDQKRKINECLVLELKAVVKLSGEITPQGAKNEALTGNPMFCNFIN